MIDDGDIVRREALARYRRGLAFVLDLCEGADVADVDEDTWRRLAAAMVIGPPPTEVEEAQAAALDVTLEDAYTDEAQAALFWSVESTGASIQALGPLDMFSLWSEIYGDAMTGAAEPAPDRRDDLHVASLMAVRMTDLTSACHAPDEEPGVYGLMWDTCAHSSLTTTTRRHGSEPRRPVIR